MGRVIRLDKVKGLVGGIVFGPVTSRRFGRSLGINPLPPDRKICTFDCPYCECGSTQVDESRCLEAQPFPSAEEVLAAVRDAMAELAAAHIPIDSLTLTGNGETTLHPDFERIIDGIIELRDAALPDARIVVLTNGTRLTDASVRRALTRVDRCVVKIDAGREETFVRINRPLERITLEDITREAAELPRVIVQTMFVRGLVDNTTDDELAAWIERVRGVDPVAVQIYSLERLPAEEGLIAVAREELAQIAAALRAAVDVPVDVY